VLIVVNSGKSFYQSSNTLSFFKSLNQFGLLISEEYDKREGKAKICLRLALDLAETL